jgi:cobalt-zinc-cadmium resistance protein CzcA
LKRWVDFVISNSTLFLVLTVAVLMVSAFLVRDLNVEAFPDPAPPMVEIVTLLEGKSGEEVERQVTIPIEISLAGIPGLTRINSTTLYGLSDIKLRFTYDTSFKDARQEVINRLSGLSLPDNAQPSLVPSPLGEVMRYALVGSNDPMELRTLQDWVVARALKTAEGVEDIPTWGGFIKSYVVTVKPETLIKYKVPLSQILDALSKSNVNVGGRVLEKGDQYYNIRGLGLIQKLEDIENVVVSYKNDTPILIKNVAQVSIGNLPKTGIAGLNGQNDIVMGVVTLRKGAKSIPSIRSVNEKIQELNDRVLPAGVKIVPIYQKWDLIVTVVTKVAETAMVGIALVALVFVILLANFRAAILAALMIPLSLLITLAVMAAQGESANLLSIAAIDFGIIADIFLILMENFFRLRHREPDGRSALIRAVQEVGGAIAFSLLIILLAFIPIFTMKGAEGQIFAPMARTYLYALAFTLLLTFTFLIAAVGRFMKNAQERSVPLLPQLTRGYVGLTDRLSKRPVVVLVVIGVLTIGAAGFSLRATGTEFLPKMDEGNIYCRMTFPRSISLTKTHEYARQVRDYFRTFPDVETVQFQVGRPEDGTDPTGPFNSEYFIKLKPYGEWKSGKTKEELEKEISDGLDKLFPNADSSVSQYIEDNLEEVMSGVKGENTLKIYGEDLVLLEKAAEEAKKRLSEIPGITEVGILRELGQPNFIIDVDRGSAAAMGLNVGDILDTISAAIGGRTVTQIIEGTKSFQLLVSFPASYRKDPEAVEAAPLVLPSGANIPLSRVARLHYDTGAAFIYRENFKRLIPIKFKVVSKDLGGTVAEAQKAVSAIALPSGYYTEWSGIFNEMKAAFQRLAMSVPIALLLILATLYALYRSGLNVAVVMAVPLFAVAGGLVSLWVMGQTLSTSSIVGFISIIGVSVLNGSIFVNHYISLRKAGKPRDEAARETSADKFRPVLMAGLVASLGLLPASLSHGIGSQVQKPLALVVVGGMLVGTVLTLLALPLLVRYVRVSVK